MIRDPWAKLTTFMTPKMSVNPMAIKLYTPPTSSPLSREPATKEKVMAENQNTEDRIQ
jgi:hypothetical protein